MNYVPHKELTIQLQDYLRSLSKSPQIAKIINFNNKEIKAKDILAKFQLLPFTCKTNTYRYHNISKTPKGYSFITRIGHSPAYSELNMSKKDYYRMVNVEKYRFLLDGVNNTDVCSAICFPIENIIAMSQAIISIGAKFVPLEGDEETIFNKIVSTKITVLFSTPSTFSKFINYINKRKIKYHLRLALTGGQKIPNYNSFSRYLKTHLGAKLVDHIGSFKLLNYAIHCKKHDYYHFIDKHQFVEIINPQTNKPSSKGEIVITPLWRKDYSLIRFRTKDYVEIKPRLTCNCAIKDPRVFSKIIKRVDENIKLNGIMTSLYDIYKETKKKLTLQNNILDPIMWKIVPPPKFSIYIINTQLIDDVLILIQKKRFIFSLRRKKPIQKFFLSTYYLQPKILLIDNDEYEMLSEKYFDLRYDTKTYFSKKIQILLKKYKKV